MSLEGGQKLAHYEIVRALGAGGMGEVYLAHDTKLKREVALKILPSEIEASSSRIFCGPNKGLTKSRSSTTLVGKGEDRGRGAFVLTAWRAHCGQ